MAGRLVYGTTALYSIVFAAAAVLHYEAFDTARLDLGTMTQAVWSTAHGHFLETTSLSGLQLMRFGVHVDPLLLLFVPLWWIWSSPLMLVVVQALAVSAGAVPVFWLARKHLGSERAAVHFAFAFLLFPATQFNVFTYSSGFHAVSLAIPLVLFAVWFLDQRRLMPFIVFALAAAATKEEIPLAVGCLGLWYALRKGERLVGLAIFATGAALTLLDFLVVIPHYSPSGVDPFVDRYAGVGGTPGGILHTAFTDPASFVHAIASSHKLVYVVLLLGPFVGLWLLEPLLFVGGAVDLAINVLSSRADQTTITSPRTAGIVPFVVAAAIVGAGRLKRDPDGVSLLALVATACIAVYSPILFARGDVHAVWSSPAAAAKAHAVSLVPARVPATASNQLAAHLSERRKVYVFPYGPNARWVVVDRNDPTYADIVGYRRAIRRLETGTGWARVYRSAGVEVFHQFAVDRSVRTG
jgi:uncharacterized membrane protein